MTFDPTQNRILTCLLTADELAALKEAIKFNGGEWHNGGDTWRAKELDAYLYDDTVYRAKPAPRPTIICNGVEVPEPVRVALVDGVGYFIADPAYDDWAVRCLWGNGDNDLVWLTRGLIHLSEADAVAHAKAMVLPGCA